MLFQKRPVGRFIKGTARNDDGMIRQRWGGFRFIDHAQQVEMLGMDGKTRDLLPTDGQKHPLRLDCQCGDGAVHVGGIDPFVAFDRRPGRTRQGQKRDARCICRRDGVPAHVLGVGMRGVDDMGDPGFLQVGGKAVGAAEAADPRRDGQGHRRFGAPGIGIKRANAINGDALGKGTGFACAAENQEGWAFAHG